MTAAAQTTSPDLRPDALMAAACAQAGGLDDFGDDAFHEPLRRFLESATTESRLSPEGLAVLQQDVVRLLVNRLLFHADLTRHPEILDEEVSDPIVILGLPRTGTTKLHRMLAADPAKQSVTLWKLLLPAPIPGSDPDGPDPRIAVAEEFQTQLAEREPAFMAAHPMVATEPEEEALLVQMTFDRLGALSWFYDTPSYHAWLEPREQTLAYEYLRDLLRYLQWQDGGRRERRWVLKTPLHTSNIETLLRVFPKSTIVHCHRDPLVIMPSFCRLVELIRRTRGHREDPKGIGAFLLELLPGEMAKNVEQRDRLGPGAPILDFAFDDIVDDVVGVIRRIHEHRGTPPSDESIDAMRAWEADNPAGKHGKHEYRLEDYGLTDDEVRTAFTQYCERFHRA